MEIFDRDKRLDKLCRYKSQSVVHEPILPDKPETK